ncbi:hypothetical protein [Thioclava electrotropha]|uniref:Lipoprotein n=1 Tax=Thioclava electrotropha TaxID=1549850 RepID=A0ABX6Z007_9RHOB|nr:hypothetical protein [Thioclava electrotropha]QPZ93353.1 hypothetical protein AKL02_020445 [Thioclava electrotropha]
MNLRFAMPLFLSGLLLTGCAAPPTEHTLDRLSADEATQVHSYAFVDRCSASIGKAEQKRLSRFLVRNAHPEKDVVIASIPRGCNAQVDRQRSATLRNLIGDTHGALRVMPSDASDPVGSHGIVRIAHIIGINVDRSECRVNSNCAVAGNLAAMISDPRDLFMPQSGNRYWKHPSAIDLSSKSGLGSDTPALN